MNCLKLSIVFILLLSLMIASMPSFAESNTAPVALIGDVDLDGAVTVKDAEFLLSCLVGKTALPMGAVECADVNGDGNITAEDAACILRISLGVI